jgi:hypothetical protein
MVHFYIKVWYKKLRLSFIGVSDQSPSEYVLQDPTFLSSTQESFACSNFKLACFVNGDAEATSTCLRYRVVLINYIWRMQILELKSEKCFESHQMPWWLSGDDSQSLYIVWSVVSQNSSAWNESTWLPSKTNIHFPKNNCKWWEMD